MNIAGVIFILSEIEKMLNLEQKIIWSYADILKVFKLHSELGYNFQKKDSN